MIENLGKFGKSRILKLSNKIWGESKKKSVGKGCCCSICKPGKDPSLAESYRPITLTSHLEKIMEKIVNERLFLRN